MAIRKRIKKMNQINNKNFENCLKSVYIMFKSEIGEINYLNKGFNEII